MRIVFPVTSFLTGKDPQQLTISPLPNLLCTTWSPILILLLPPPDDVFETGSGEEFALFSS